MYFPKSLDEIREGLVTLLKFLILVLLISTVISCSGGHNDATHSVKPMMLTGETMGTTYHITLYPLSEQTLSQRSSDIDLETKQLKQSVDQFLIDFNSVMSTYLPDSELSQLNKEDQLNICIPVTYPLFQVIKLAKQVGEQSNHYFDMTVAPIVDAWGFGPVEVKRLPTSEEVKSFVRLVGDTAILLDDQASCITKSADRWIDLSGIAKGYGVDQVAELLRERGYTQFLIEIGGEVWAEGKKPDGSDWRIAVEAPLKHEAKVVQRALTLANMGVASSGDYRNFYEKDGKAYSHTIDPHTAKPVDHHLVSTTVLAKTTAEADAWATGLLAMGTKKALALANKLSLPVLLIERGEHGALQEYQSQAMERYIVHIGSKL